MYYHKGKKECDFIAKKGIDVLQAIQVCTDISNEKTYKREIEGLIEAMAAYSIKEGLLLTLDEESQEIIEKSKTSYIIHIKPVWKWFLEEG